MINSLNRPAKFRAFTSFYLNKGNGAIALDHEVDVAVPASKAPLDDSPTASPKPAFRDPFSELPECLPGR